MTVPLEGPPEGLARFVALRVAASLGLALVLTLLLFGLTGRLERLGAGRLTVFLIAFGMSSALLTWLRFRRRPLPSTWWR